MDLRSVLNTSDNGDGAAPKAPPTPQQQHQPRPAPSPAQYGYREFAHGSPGKPMGPDYAHHPPPAAYPYHAPGQYPARPPSQAGPPLHHVPSPGPMQVPAPSPYRPSPTNAPAGGTTAYPSPPTQPAMTSPGQRHQYPPGHLHQSQPQPPLPRHQRRDSYSQGVAAHGSGAAYVQQPPVSQTPSHPYLHQRSQSVHSTPTPASAHQFGPAHVHGSPIAAAQPPPAEFHHQHPLPPAPPVSAAGPRRAATTPGGFAQPPSPYQQRISSAGSAQPAQQHPAPPLALQPASSAHGAYDSPAASDGRSRPRSRHERDHSSSVSPRTRVASLASNPDPPPESEKRDVPPVRNMVVDVESAVTPAKRKLDDRSMSPKELEPRGARPPPGEVNGGVAAGGSRASASPAAARMKRMLRAQPPLWAQNAHSLGNKMPRHANFVLHKRAHVHVNGKHDGGHRPDRSSRPSSPESARAQHSSASSQAHPLPAAEPGPQAILGPWEASITGVKPYEEIAKTVADFIFIHVVNNGDVKEMASRGIQFEIEAKLGTLIDKDTNYRVDKLLDSECILRDTGRIAFKSSMTEVHHKAFNDFLNRMVIETDPRAPNRGGRVQVHYEHRREVDRFFDLPADLQSQLPGCMRSRLGSRSRNVRVRVTYDQKTREVLNKIIKARVADIDLHMPSCPMDCRLSINLEMAWDGAVEELEQLAANQGDRQPDRSKDRLSYTQGHYQIDLTQVTQSLHGPGNSQRVEKEHELEIELAPGIVMDQGAKAMNGAPHRYQELIEGLLDNVRVLARKAKEFS